MAKIYETEKDVQRDALKTHLAIGSAVNSVGTSNGIMAGFAAAMMFVAKYFIPEKAKNVFGGSMRKNMGTGALLAGGMSLAGLAAAVGGYMVKKRAQAELDKLGPEQVVNVSEAESYMATKADHVKRLAQKESTEQAPVKML